jgi:hypothetical protein
VIAGSTPAVEVAESAGESSIGHARARPHPPSSPRPVFWAWAFVSAVSSLPYLRAWLLPPRGTRFLGFFYAIPDVYNYLSYVQQAADGAWLFVNKLYPSSHTASLANVEWLLVGWLSALIGGQSTVAYRLFGVTATLALMLASDRWLRRCGLPNAHRFAALLLVFTAGGPGGLLFRLLGPPAWRFLDLTTGIYPFISVLVNPHFVAGSALLLWALWAMERARGPRGQLLAAALGSLLVLVRPYELALLVGTRVVVVLITEPRSQWLRSLLPLAWLAPAFVYGWLTLVVNPAYAVFSAVKYSPPALAPIVLALLPALAVALVALPRLLRQSLPAERRAILTLAAWPLVVLVIVVLPLRWGLQAAVDVALPLLCLVALALRTFAPAVTLAAALALSSTSIVALGLLLEDNTQWFVPRERFEAALALRRQCRPGDLVVAPADIGLYANAWTACRAYVAHLGEASAEERAAEVEWFYGATPPERRSWLEARCAQYVILPDDGPQPERLLGPGTPYRRIADVRAQNGLSLAVYGGGPRDCTRRPGPLTR